MPRRAVKRWQCRKTIGELIQQFFQIFRPLPRIAVLALLDKLGRRIFFENMSCKYQARPW